MSRMREYIQVLLHSDPADAGLNRHRWGLPPWSSEFQIRPRVLLPIQYSPLSPNSPADLQLCQYLDHLAKGPYREQIPTTRLLQIAYTTKHSGLSLSFFHRGTQSGLVRVFLMQLGFHQTPILKCTIMA
jgi:hypothetical protein